MPTPRQSYGGKQKAAKERGDFNLSKQKLTEAIESIGPVKKVGYDEILRYVGAQKHPIPKGKLKPPKDGVYTGVWQFPILCSPVECPGGGFDKTTESHSALVFFTSAWHSLAPAYNYNFDLVMGESWVFQLGRLFSFDGSFILNPTMKKGGKPLILKFHSTVGIAGPVRQCDGLFLDYGLSDGRAGLGGGKDYHPEKMKGKAPTVQEILNGKWDNYIRKVAREAKTLMPPCSLN